MGIPVSSKGVVEGKSWEGLIVREPPGRVLALSLGCHGPLAPIRFTYSTLRERSNLIAGSSYGCLRGIEAWSIPF